MPGGTAPGKTELGLRGGAWTRPNPWAGLGWGCSFPRNPAPLSPQVSPPPSPCPPLRSPTHGALPPKAWPLGPIRGWPGLCVQGESRRAARWRCPQRPLSSPSGGRPHPRDVPGLVPSPARPTATDIPPAPRDTLPAGVPGPLGSPGLQASDGAGALVPGTGGVLRPPARLARARTLLSRQTRCRLGPPRPRPTLRAPPRGAGPAQGEGPPQPQPQAALGGHPALPGLQPPPLPFPPETARVDPACRGRAVRPVRG